MSHCIYRKKCRPRKDRSEVLSGKKGILYINMQAKTWFFNSHERFKSESELNMSINIGLKETGKDIGV